MNLDRNKDTQLGRHRWFNLAYFLRTKRNKYTDLYKYPLCKYGTVI